MTTGGRLFQRRLLATGNARSPTVDSRVCRITSCKENDDRRWQQRFVRSLKVMVVGYSVDIAHSTMRSASTLLAD